MMMEHPGMTVSRRGAGDKSQGAGKDNFKRLINDQAASTKRIVNSIAGML